VTVSASEAESLAPVYPGGKLKALTMRYDDGKQSDRQLVDIFNTYGIKGTFYLIPYYMEGDSRYVQKADVKALYLDNGHEIANHSYTHPSPGTIEADVFCANITNGKNYLDLIAPGKVTGFAYPYSNYGKDKQATLATLASTGHTYAVAGESSNSFDIPDMSKPYEIAFTMRHAAADYDFVEVAKDFVNLTPSSQKLFYIMGHSDEFEEDSGYASSATYAKKSWDDITEFCRVAGGKDDIWYAANGDVFNYLLAQHAFGTPSQPGTYQNRSSVTVYYKTGETLITLNPGDVLEITQ